MEIVLKITKLSAHASTAGSLTASKSVDLMAAAIYNQMTDRLHYTKRDENRRAGEEDVTYYFWKRGQ